MAAKQALMHQALSGEVTGSHREKTSQASAGAATQEVFDWPDTQAVTDGVGAGYDVLRECVAAFGGQKKLALWLGEDLSYNSKINEGLNRKGDRHAFFDWLIPLLRHSVSGPMFLRWACAEASHKMPEPIVHATTEELLRALLAEVEEANGVGKSLLDRAAKRIGTDAGAFRKGR